MCCKVNLDEEKDQNFVRKVLECIQTAQFYTRKFFSEAFTTPPQEKHWRIKEKLAFKFSRFSSTDDSGKTCFDASKYVSELATYHKYNQFLNS